MPKPRAAEVHLEAIGTRAFQTSTDDEAAETLTLPEQPIGRRRLATIFYKGVTPSGQHCSYDEVSFNGRGYEDAIAAAFPDWKTLELKSCKDRRRASKGQRALCNTPPGHSVPRKVAADVVFYISACQKKEGSIQGPLWLHKLIGLFAACAIQPSGRVEYGPRVPPHTAMWQRPATEWWMTAA
jgi:hypothetical protein